MLFTKKINSNRHTNSKMAVNGVFIITTGTRKPAGTNEASNTDIRTASVSDWIAVGTIFASIERVDVMIMVTNLSHQLICELYL